MISRSDPVARPATRADRHGRTLGAGRDLRRRLLLHHLPIALASTAGLWLLTSLAPPRGRGFSISRLASPTGDAALVLLGLTLLVGPANLLLGRRNPPNNYLRRDLGAWTAAYGIVHVVAGFQGHSGGAFGLVGYFVADGRPLTDGFGLGNWTGLAATVIVAGLLVISTGPVRARAEGTNVEAPAAPELHAVRPGGRARDLLRGAAAGHPPLHAGPARHRRRGARRTVGRGLAVAAKARPYRPGTHDEDEDHCSSRSRC
jgi:hypothetical protein